MSIVRRNLLREKGYTPYCGSESCNYDSPRTKFNGSQFVCQCSWSSNFEKSFIEEVIKFNKDKG